MDTTSLGRSIEQAVAHHLARKGYRLIESNWRTKYCEVDLIMQHKKEIVFIEVKYRRNSRSGSGFDYVTPKKIQQLYFAVDYWCALHDYEGDVSLMAASVDGQGGLVRLLPIER